MERESFINSEEFKKESKKIDYINNLTILITFGMILLVIFIDYPQISDWVNDKVNFISSISFGSIVGLVNLWLIKKVVMALLFENRGKSQSMIKSLIKFLILLGIGLFIILNFQISLTGFAIGFSCMVVSIILVGLLTSLLNN